MWWAITHTSFRLFLYLSTFLLLCSVQYYRFVALYAPTCSFSLQSIVLRYVYYRMERVGACGALRREQTLYVDGLKRQMDHSLYMRFVFYSCTLWTGAHGAISWSETNICLFHFNLLHRIHQFRECRNKKQTYGCVPIFIASTANL